MSVRAEIAEPRWLTFTVRGVPVTQGAVRSLGAGRPSVHANADRLKPWRLAVQHAAERAMRQHESDRFLGPVELRLLFGFDRPRGHYRTGKHGHLLRDTAPLYPATRAVGDLDKLVRACGDALEAAGAVKDDAQIVRLLAQKVWCGEHEEALDVPGVRVWMREMT